MQVPRQNRIARLWIASSHTNFVKPHINKAPYAASSRTKGSQWGIFPVREIRGFPILLSRSGKNCQNFSRSGNKMINFYMSQHIARRINTNQRIAKTNSPAKS